MANLDALKIENMERSGLILQNNLPPRGVNPASSATMPRKVHFVLSYGSFVLRKESQGLRKEFEKTKPICRVVN